MNLDSESLPDNADPFQLSGTVDCAESFSSGFLLCDRDVDMLTAGSAAAHPYAYAAAATPAVSISSECDAVLTACARAVGPGLRAERKAVLGVLISLSEFIPRIQAVEYCRTGSHCGIPAAFKLLFEKEELKDSVTAESEWLRRYQSTQHCFSTSEDRAFWNAQAKADHLPAAILAILKVLNETKYRKLTHALSQTDREQLLGQLLHASLAFRNIDTDVRRWLGDHCEYTICVAAILRCVLHSDGLFSYICVSQARSQLQWILLCVTIQLTALRLLGISRPTS